MVLQRAVNVLVIVTSLSAVSFADDPIAGPKPIPETRPEMKRALEALKGRQSRLPLPPLAEDGEASRDGRRSVVHNGRARRLYLPESWYAADFRNDPAMTLDDTFKVELFWIVSRGNNCHYCLGHQEIKLTMAGRTEEEIASLDGGWSAFSPQRYAAMEFTRKLTLSPHRVSGSDLALLRKHYTDRQIVELVHTVASFNSVNRWTDSLGLPQDERFRDHAITFLTPTSSSFASQKTSVAPVGGMPPRERVSREEAERQLAACRRRAPRVALVSETEARGILPAGETTGAPPQWVRALAHFPTIGALQVRALRATEREGRLAPALKAQLAWICARENHAWYALGHAQKRLGELGFDPGASYELDQPEGEFSPGQREAFAFARKLTSSPQRVADADLVRLRHHYSDHETAEIVYVICAANYFNRFTEALGLALEP